MVLSLMLKQENEKNTSQEKEKDIRETENPTYAIGIKFVFRGQLNNFDVEE